VLDRGGYPSTRVHPFVPLVGFDQTFGSPDVFGFFEPRARGIRAHAGEQSSHIRAPAVRCGALPVMQCVTGSAGRDCGGQSLGSSVRRQRQTAAALHLFEAVTTREEEPSGRVRRGDGPETGRRRQSRPAPAGDRSVDEGFGSAIRHGYRFQTAGQRATDPSTPEVGQHLHVEPRRIRLLAGLGLVESAAHHLVVHPRRDHPPRLVRVPEVRQLLRGLMRQFLGSVPERLDRVRQFDTRHEIGGVWSVDGCGCRCVADPDCHGIAFHCSMPANPDQPPGLLLPSRRSADRDRSVS